MAERKVIRPIPRRYKLAGVLAAIAVLYGATLLFSRLVMPAPRTALPPHTPDNYGLLPLFEKAIAAR